MREEALILIKRWSEVDYKDVLPLLTGMFSLNHAIKSGIRVCNSFRPEVINSFKQIRLFALQVLKQKVDLVEIELILN